MMKLGCSVWSLTGRYGPPYGDALETIAELGFEGTELIVDSTDQIRDFFSPAQCEQMRDRLSGLGLELSQFVAYKDMIDGLASMDQARIGEALEIWEQCCAIARALGTDTINTVSHWIPGLTSPNPYPPAFVHVSKSPQGAFSPKISFDYPPFDWDEVWSSYVSSIQRCCDIAARYGLRLALEGHPHVIVSHTDSFLAFHREVARENFGMNYDTGMQTDQIVEHRYRAEPQGDFLEMMLPNLRQEQRHRGNAKKQRRERKDEKRMRIENGRCGQRSHQKMGHSAEPRG